MTPRRVLMTADAVGGVWTYALDLAQGLNEADIAVRLAVLGPAPSPDQESPDARPGRSPRPRSSPAAPPDPDCPR